MQEVMNKAPATVDAGGTWSSLNSVLNTALGAWAKVEQIKGAKAASGQDVVQARVVPELENGAAVLIDSNLSQATSKNDSVITLAGMDFDKNITYATGGILLTLILYKKFIK